MSSNAITIPAQIEARPWVDELHQWHSAHAFAQRLRFPGSLQPHVHHAWDNHDFLRGHASPVWICELLGPVDDWCAGHGISPPECIQRLAVVSGRTSLVLQLCGWKRSIWRGKRAGRGLVVLCASWRASL